MDMSSESSARTWYETPRSLEPPSGGAGVAGVVGNDYRGYYPHAGPTHHPAAAAHYAHSKYTVPFAPSFNRLHLPPVSLSFSFFFRSFGSLSFFSLFFLPEKLSSRSRTDWWCRRHFLWRLSEVEIKRSDDPSRKGLTFFYSGGYCAAIKKIIRIIFEPLCSVIDWNPPRWFRCVHGRSSL